ncbi:hypothetical protein H6F67_09235 [Microcoleus sp. FACHB-1515]|uniref:hypothetical protein n=1 Tax=Cyanophyceae TaxID=3028117 RepID=UPI001689EEC1|nr:hypothetical protein [Microcoleus sp. FACHB-1515]MBD2090034.1 hypothetical protein [Microcoleus sp. FACHB-1515]
MKLSFEKFLKGTFALLIILGIAIALLFKLLPIWPAIALRNIQETQVGALLNSTFFATLVVERSLEVLLTIWRGEGKSIWENELARYEPGTPAFQRVQDELNRYGHETKSIALRAGFVLGIVVSLVGFRILEPLIVLEAIDSNQRIAFQTLDIILTGLTISAGSNVFHDVISVFTDFLRATRGRIGNQSADSSPVSNPGVTAQYRPPFDP